MRFAKIGGLTLHYEYREKPGAPLVAFINSLGTDFRIWDSVVERMAGDYATLRYDKRGHGLSDLGHPPYTIPDLAADLGALLDHVGAARAVLCGLSVGGLIAQSLAAARPGLVQALILCDTAHRIGTDDMWNSRIATVRSQGIGSLADGILEKWFTPAFHKERAAELAGCRNMLVRQFIEGYAGTCAAIRDADNTEIVRRISVPTLCVVGDQDGSTPPALVKSMAELIGGSGYEVIEGAGHIPCIERPAELVALFTDFLAANGFGVPSEQD